MPDQIMIGNFSKGLTTNRLPFVIDNDAFPTMYNMYSWRGRAKRKRGTLALARLERQLQLAAVPNQWQYAQFALVAGAGNLLTAISATSTASISTSSPGTVGKTYLNVGTLFLVDYASDGNLYVGRGITGASQANPCQITTVGHGLSTGNQIYIQGVGGMTQLNGIIYTITVTGANTFTLNGVDSTAYTAFTSGGGWITTTPAASIGGSINYATGAITVSGGAANNVTGFFSYYPGLPVLGLEDYVAATSSSQYPLLLAFDDVYAYQINQATPAFYSISYYKGSNNPVVWSGTDYQQFWSTNYSGAFWATNNKPGFQFQNILTVTVGNPTIITTAAAHGLVTGDYVFFNEITGANAGTLNGKAFAITKTGANTFTVAVDTTAMAINNNGIFQTLTKTSQSGDGIRWYDGDPTNKTGLPTTTSTGWVNFAPPLTATSVSINNETAALYYLVGAQAIVPFKDRLLFFSPWIQTSNGAAIQLQDTVIWSWNGTPYYNALVPTGETFDVTAWYVDAAGRGGYLSAGISQPIVTVTNNEDVLLVGFSSRQTRFVYTGNDFSPFLFYSINSEFGSSSTFSGVTLDKGGMSIGTYGIFITTQYSSERIDLQIPDQVFQIQALNNGVQRVNSVRDYFREWIYFSYPVNNTTIKFPTQTLLLNYRDNTWATLKENFTAHGTFRKTTGYTWATVPFAAWAAWREPWNSGSTSALFPNIIAGNPQGFVVIKGQGTGEAQTGNIAAIANSAGETQITSIDHCVQVGDYLYILGCLGTTALNTQIGRVRTVVDKDNFVIDLAFPAGTYGGLGTFARLSQPLIQSKQFPIYWEEGRQVRLGTQKYLLDRTANGQVTLNIYLSQDPDNAWNGGSIVPTLDPKPVNNSLEFSQVLFTCPETDPFNVIDPTLNLQTPTAGSQYQIWHRVSTSLQGESVQIGITLNDTQMRNLTYATSEIALQGIQLTVYKGPLLA